MALVGGSFVMSSSLKTLCLENRANRRQKQPRSLLLAAVRLFVLCTGIVFRVKGRTAIMSRSPHQLTSVYHLIHYAVFGYFFLQLYPSLRSISLETEIGRERLLSRGYTALTHEQEVCCIMVIGFLYKNIDKGGILHRLFQALMITSIVLTWLTGNRLALWGVMAVYTAMFVLLVPPSYKGDSNIRVLENSLQDMKGNASHLILCQTLWSRDCRYFEPVFCQLSVQYSSPMLHFHSLDLSKNAELATELEIDTTSRSKQLPSLILFYRGEQVRRYPPFQDDGKVIKTTMNKVRLTFSLL